MEFEDFEIFDLKIVEERKNFETESGQNEFNLYLIGRAKSKSCFIKVKEFAIVPRTEGQTISKDNALLSLSPTKSGMGVMPMTTHILSKNKIGLLIQGLLQGDKWKKKQ